MDISLIICTRDRCQQLNHCLKSVGEILFDRAWEVVIVDNGSIDETGVIVREFARSVSAPVRYVFEPALGLGNARNSGVGAACGTILAFTDDDCYPEADFLSQIWSAFADDPSLGYISGRIMLHDPADHPISINESTTSRIFPGRSFIRSGCVQGANMAFRRRVLLDISGFDPLFGTGSLFAAEDLDAAGRASAIGWKGQYRPEVAVRHHHRRKASDAPRVWKSYAIGRGAYHMKLLLVGGEFLWFARSLYQLRWRFRLSRGTLFWELVGAVRYAYFYMRQALRGWVARARS